MGSLATFRIRVAAAVKARMEREGLGLSDLARALGMPKNKLFRALHHGQPGPSTGLIYASGPGPYFALVDWLGEDAADLCQPRVTTTWREVEEAIEQLGDTQLADFERIEMIGHIRLVRAASLRRERERGEGAV